MQNSYVMWHEDGKKEGRKCNAVAKKRKQRVQRLDFGTKKRLKNANRYST